MKVPAASDKVVSKKSIPLKHVFPKRGVPNVLVGSQRASVNKTAKESR